MLEIAQYFGQTAAHFSPIVLIGLGSAFVSVGLFVWLGGLGLGKVLAGVTGAVAGGAYGFFFLFDRSIIPAGLPAMAGAGFAVILGRILVIGSGFWRFISALCCAVLGTTLVFAGMVLLLLYKGALPVDAISRKQPFYAAVFIAMIVFGTIEQFLLCCQRTGKTEKEAKKGKEKPDKTTLDWRTR